MKTNDYYIERMDNGLIRLFSYYSGLSAYFNPDGTHRHGCYTSAFAQAVAAWLDEGH
jgi:hypothetical protein